MIILIVTSTRSTALYQKVVDVPFTSCLVQFPAEEIHMHLLNTRELTKDELDFVIMGQLLAFKSASRKVTYMFGGKNVCRHSFLFLNGLARKDSATYVNILRNLVLRQEHMAILKETPQIQPVWKPPNMSKNLLRTFQIPLACHFLEGYLANGTFE